MGWTTVPHLVALLLTAKSASSLIGAPCPIINHRNINCRNGFIQTHEHRNDVSTTSSSLKLSQSISEHKSKLLIAIDKFDEFVRRDGTVSIDFGVKGGELDTDTRAPVIIDFRQRSTPDVAGAAEDVIGCIERLSEQVQSEGEHDSMLDATKFLGTTEGNLCPLHGTWLNRFTNAADATFSKDSKRGDATVYNVVDGITGTIWNIIDFKTFGNEDGDSEEEISKPSPLEQLRVKLSSQALSKSRVGLTFRLVKARLNRFLFPLFGRKITLTLPVPGPFITRILFALRRGKKKPPPAYFDVLYIDDDLRVHRTGQGAYFVQERAPWS